MTSELTLESVLTSEQITKLEEEVATIACEAHQPLLNRMVERMGMTRSTAKLEADTSFALNVHDGEVTITEHVALHIVFSPMNSPDPVDTVQRELVSTMLNKILEHSK